MTSPGSIWQRLVARSALGHQTPPARLPESSPPDRATLELKVLEHQKTINAARREQEVEQLQHEARLAVLRWRRDHPQIASAWVEPYPGYGPHPKHGRNAMPPPAPPAPQRKVNPLAMSIESHEKRVREQAMAPRTAELAKEQRDRIRAALEQAVDGSAMSPWVVDDRWKGALCRLKDQCPAPEPVFRLNTSRDVAVATDTYFNEDMTTCPRGAKVQLLGAGGVASYGVYNGDSFWIGWAPVPRRRPL